MQYFIKLLIVFALVTAPRINADTYYTDATMSHQKDEGTINVIVRVSRLLDQDGEITEQLIAEQKILSVPDHPATTYTGLSPTHQDYDKEENVSVEVSWPYPNESGTAFCTITIKRGDRIVSKSRLQLEIEGPGRVPLILEVEDINSKSVRVWGRELKTFVLLEFADKSKAEVKN